MTPLLTVSTRRSTLVTRTSYTYADLAAVYALEGRTDEMWTALIEARRLNPDLTVKWLIDHAPNLPPLFDGLRKAGLPEE